jgi:DNA-binding NarL/FixJ family response regulator
MEKIRILLADDQSLIRDGIRIILDSQPDMEVVATAETGTEAVEKAEALQPALILMDIRMPACSGIEALKAIKSRRPETVVLMLTTFDPDEYIYGAFEGGADGYLLKDMPGERLISTVRYAAAGSILIPAPIAARLIARIPRDASKTRLSDYGLTKREQEIAELIRNGCRNGKIAEKLGISHGTARNYISTLYSKLGVATRREAVRLISGLGK